MLEVALPVLVSAGKNQDEGDERRTARPNGDDPTCTPVYYSAGNRKGCRLILLKEERPAKRPTDSTFSVSSPSPFRLRVCVLSLLLFALCFRSFFRKVMRFFNGHSGFV